MLTSILRPSHIAILPIVLLLIFGPERLPQTGRALGHGLREFKDAITRDADTTDDPELEPPPKP
jgi:sec-independent protein translocase protein TatA